MMSFDLSSAVSTEPSLRVAVQETGQKIFGRCGHDVETGEVKRLLQDLAVHFGRVLIVERRKTS